MSKANVGADEVETIVSEITLAQFRHRLQRVLASSGLSINNVAAPVVEEQVF
jgi:hypothetical protein